MASLCSAFSSMRIAPRVRLLLYAGVLFLAQALSSKRCGINVAPKISAAVPEARAAPVCMAIEAKLKTRKAMSKRYKVTSTGKVMRRHAGKQHSNEKKAHKRLKRLSKEESVFIGDVKNNVRRAMPYHKISLQKQREANQKHDARGPGHY